jgi:Ca-activated chloride channel family protein
VYGKWKGPRAGEIEVTGMSASGPYAATFRMADTPSIEENRGLGLLWARARVARLSDLSGAVEDPALASEITGLGLRYSMLTRFTSFIAVLERVRNPEGDAVHASQPLPRPAGVSEHAGAVPYAMGAEPELWMMGMIGAALISILLWRRP